MQLENIDQFQFIFTSPAFTTYIPIQDFTPVDLGWERGKIIKACMNVHNELGSGFLEPVYQSALAVKFDLMKIPYRASCQFWTKFSKMRKNHKSAWKYITGATK